MWHDILSTSQTKQSKKKETKKEKKNGAPFELLSSSSSSWLSNPVEMKKKNKLTK